MTSILEKQLQQKLLPSERATLRASALVTRGNIPIQHGLVLKKADKERRREIGGRFSLSKLGVVAQSQS